MSARLRQESGFAVIAALLLMLVMLGIGLAIASRVETQQHQARYERNRESSFNIAEAALGAEAVQLGRNWPATAASPSTCDPTSTNTACPQASAIGGGYTAVDYASPCPSAPSTPAWQTTIRDNAAGEQYWSTAVSSRAGYDANADGLVWLRSTGFVQCRTVSMVALVARTLIPIAFPNNVLTANFFQVTNQGRKVIVDTSGAYAQPPSLRPAPGSSAQPAALAVRCSGLTTSQCLSYQSGKGQIQPPTAAVDASMSTSALGLTQLQALEQQAQAAGTYWPNAGGACPLNTAAGLSSVNGAPVVIKGPCAVSIGAGTVVNSSTAPGALIIENGTLTMSGNGLFYGLVYCVNQQNSSGTVITISGTATIQGSVAVDGAGGVSAGSSKTNLIYDPRAAALLKGSSGAAVVKNTFRALPANTP